MEATARTSAAPETAQRTHKHTVTPPPDGYQNGTAYSFAISRGAFVTVPAFDTAPRAKNHLATIEHDPTAPAGLSRHFHDFAHGAYFYSAAELQRGDAVEIAADLRSGRNYTTRRRIYAAVESLTTDAEGSGAASLRFFDTAERAIAHARQIKANSTIGQRAAALARQFAREFAAAVEDFAAAVESFSEEATQGETAETLAARAIVSASHQHDSDGARSLRAYNFALTMPRA